MRLEIDTPSDGGPVNSECGVGLLEADREDNCAGRGRILAPIIVIYRSAKHLGEVPKLYAVYPLDMLMSPNWAKTRMVQRQKEYEVQGMCRTDSTYL